MKIKGLFLASATIAAFPMGAVDAADLPARMPVKAAPVVAPPFNWTGFYVGANLGAVWGRSEVDPVNGGPFFTSDSNTYSGVIGGVQAGYNWQFSSIVLGIEGDFDLSSASKSVAFPVFTFDTHNMRLSALSTIRGRAGFAFDRWLAYATGGVAFADLKNEMIGPSFTIDRGEWATGWTVGGGLEYAFADRWSAKAEYLYAKFPDKTVTEPGGYIFTFKDSISVARVGINYRF